MQKWSPLEHELFRHLESQELSLAGKSLLLAVSGGLDSMVMMALLQRLQEALKYQLVVICLHHGPTEDPLLAAYRDQSLALVQKTAKEKGLAFFSQKSSAKLDSEAELRDFRKNAVEKIRLENNFDYSVWAHHENDFLETQILRLIRGTGKTGLEPMLYVRGAELRPLLKLSRNVLFEYAKQQNISFLEDPSNLDLSYLRNWVRQSWLPQLEEKCPGALKAFARSLGILTEENLGLPEGIFLDHQLSRSLYMTLTEAQKKQCLAQYLRAQGQMQFTQNQIIEIMKRLDNLQIEHRFNVAQMLWNVSRDWIFAEPTFL